MPKWRIRGIFAAGKAFLVTLAGVPTENISIDGIPDNVFVDLNPPFDLECDGLENCDLSAYGNGWYMEEDDSSFDDDAIK